jgi:hypothetical protein
MTLFHFIGSCVDSFDDDGDCINDRLPLRDASHFAVELEEATPITREQFVDACYVARPLEFDDEFMVICEGEIFVCYDTKNDVHYFYGVI